MDSVTLSKKACKLLLLADNVYISRVNFARSININPSELLVPAEILGLSCLRWYLHSLCCPWSIRGSIYQRNIRFTYKHQFSIFSVDCLVPYCTDGITMIAVNLYHIEMTDYCWLAWATLLCFAGYPYFFLVGAPFLSRDYLLLKSGFCRLLTPLALFSPCHDSLLVLEPWYPS